MMSVYGPYSASATGGNGLSRDLLAGLAVMIATPFYEVIGGPDYRFKLEWPSTILAVMGLGLMIPIYVFYHKGESFRESSKFASSMGEDKDEDEGSDDEDED
jgi:hypothetical protein